MDDAAQLLPGPQVATARRSRSLAKANSSRNNYAVVYDMVVKNMARLTHRREREKHHKTMVH